MSALFIAATGTDIGKTFVTVGLIAALRRAGRPVAALKPVMSGFDAKQPEVSDAGWLLSALGRPVSPETLDQIAPWRFAAALSPDMAAEREGRRIDVAAVIDFCRRAVTETAPASLLIEGIGGIMVPLDAQLTVLDWMAALGAPVLLVAGSYLGTLSHTLTALQVLRARGLRPAAVVINESPGSAVPLDETSVVLRRYVDVIPVLTLPRLSAPDDGGEVFDRLARVILAATGEASGHSDK